MRIGSIANLVGMLGVSFFLVSTPVLAQTSSGACDTTGNGQPNPVTTVTTTVHQAVDSSHGGGSFWGHAWSFTKGLAIGVATGIAVTAGMAALAATAPVWVTGLVTATLVGAGIYGAYKLYQNWGGMSTDDKLFLAGNVVGGLVSGGVSGTVTKGVTGLLAGGESSVADVAASSAAGAARAPVRVQGFLQGQKPTCVPNAFRAIMHYWNGEAAPSVDELSAKAITRGFAHDMQGGFSTKNVPALAQEYGYQVSHIPSGATAADVAATTEQGLPVLTKIVVDAQGNPTVAGAPGALGKHAVVIQEITQDGMVIAKHGWQTADYVWPLSQFDASMQSAGGEMVVLHGPSPILH